MAEEIAAVLGITLLLALAAAAPPAPASETVVVTGTRVGTEDVHRRATAFIRATGVAAGEVPAARWAEPVCPRVVGITDDAARLVEAQVRAVAADAGIAAAPAPCTPNIAIVFTPDANVTVRTMVARTPRRFARMPAAAVTALKNGMAPIRWWYTSEVRDKDGTPASSSSPPPGIFGPAEGGGTVLPGNEDMTFIQHFNTSSISTGSIRALFGATIVVDVSRTDGLPLSAVAAYAAIVGLAEVRPGAAPPASVLALFGGEVHRSPTPWDMAFLRALYRLPLDRTALHQRDRLAADIAAAIG